MIVQGRLRKSQLGHDAAADAARRQDSMNRINSSRLGMFGMLGLMGLVCILGGCVSYTNVPVPSSAPAFKNANHYQSITVLTRALESVINEHPVDGAYAINLPSGTTPETFGKITARLPAGAVMPTDEMSSDMPIYHIGRIWIRASDAKVDVIYPFTGMDGVTSDQNVTIWLSGGVRRWRVYRKQHWSAGTIPTPPVYMPAWSDDGADDGFVDEPNGSSAAPEPTYEDAWLPTPEQKKPEVIVEPASTSTPAPVIRQQQESLGGGEVGNGYRQVPLQAGE